MKNLFRVDSPIMEFLSHLADLVLLSLIWIVCCIPVFTGGAATAALYGVLLKHADKMPEPAIRGFFRRFKENFKQGTLMWVIWTLMALLAGVDLFVILTGAVGDSVIVMGIFCVPIVVLVLVMGYLYPMIAFFQVKTWQALKNSAILALCYLPVSLAVGVLNCLPIAMAIFLPEQFFRTGIVWILIAPGLIANLNSYLLIRVFRKVMPKESTEV